MSVGWDEVFPEPAPVPGRYVTRRRVAVATLVTAIAMAVGGVAWLLTYSPLEPGSLSGAPGGSAAWSAADTGVGDVVYYVSAGKPGVFEIGFEVTNGGRLPVTLRGLGSPTIFTLAGMAPYPTYEEPNNEAAGQIVPFEPVTLDPGDSRFLMLQLRIEGEKVCTQSGGSFVPSDPGLRFRTLGIVPGEQTVPLPFTVVGMCGNALPPDYDARAGR
ncbi:MAG: hypothetical protein ACRDM2_11535 [Gaiellaceae bacterium]